MSLWLQKLLVGLCGLCCAGMALAQGNEFDVENFSLESSGLTVREQNRNSSGNSIEDFPAADTSEENILDDGDQDDPANNTERIDFGNEQSNEFNAAGAQGSKPTAARPVAEPVAPLPRKLAPPPLVQKPVSPPMSRPFESPALTDGLNSTPFGDDVKDIGGSPAPAAAAALPARSPISNAVPSFSVDRPSVTDDDIYAPAAVPDYGPVARDILEPNEFAGVPPVPGSRRIMAAGEAPDEYRVQDGDTLYDICDQLIDEPNYWPKLWALNPDIKNPHFIFPGMVLRFYPGDENTPPFLQVVNEDDIVPVDKGGLVQAELVGSGDIESLLIEDLAKTPIEVLSTEQLDVPMEVSDAIETVGAPYYADGIKLQVPAFIYGEQVASLGSVIGGISGENLAGDGREIIIETEGKLSAGTVYSIIRDAGEVENVDGDFVGYRYEFVANAKVSRSVGDEHVQASVMLSRLGARPGDLVVNFVSTQRSVPISGTVGGLAGANCTVIGFDHAEQRVGGKGSYVFFDQKLSPGTVVPIYQLMNERATSLFEGSLPTVERAVGFVRIIDASDVASVGYAVRVEDGIRIGDLVGKG